VAWDLDEYRREAEVFLEEIDREYYLQGAGHKPDLAVEPIYERHGGLFERESVDRVGEARRTASLKAIDPAILNAISDESTSW